VVVVGVVVVVVSSDDAVLFVFGSRVLFSLLFTEF
jgi:hypothetical protein